MSRIKQIKVNNVLYDIDYTSGSGISIDSEGVINLDLTQQQQSAINSGITSSKVSLYDNFGSDIEQLSTNKQDKLSSTQLSTLDSGITSTKVTTYDGYASTIASVNARIDTTIASVVAGLNGSATASTGKALSSVTETAGRLSGFTEATIPTDTGDLTNYNGGAPFQTATDVNTTLSGKLNESTNTYSSSNTLSYNGDTVTLSIPYKNLYTGVSGTKTETIGLANSTTAGLMTSSDVVTLAEHSSKIAALEGKLSYRVLYVINDTLRQIGSYPIAFTIKGVVYSIEGSTITEHNGASPEPTYEMDSEGNVEIHGIDYTFDVANMHGERAASKKNISAFAINEGYVSPYRGVEIVVDETHHVWRYYTNEDMGQIIGWKDDGVDTVNIFTNTTPGLILGRSDVLDSEGKYIYSGKIYAEQNGVGAVIGWDNLVSRVETLEQGPQNVVTFLSGTEIPSTGTLGQIFFNTNTNRVYIYNGTMFEAMNTYQSSSEEI